MGQFIFLFILILVAIAYIVIKKDIKDSNPVTPLLKDEMSRLGYTVIKERPLTLWETYQYHEPGYGPIFINRIPLDRLQYKTTKLRHMVVKNEKDHYFELFIRMFKTWDNLVTCEVLRKIRIMDTSNLP
jgi:hypothetical protein